MENPSYPRLQLGGGHLFDRVCLDHVSDFDVLESLDRDATFESLLDFTHVVFESSQRIDLAFEDDDVVTQDASVSPPNRPVGYITACNLSDPGHSEDLTHLGVASDDFTFCRFQQSEHGIPNFFFNLVDDRVEPNVYSLGLGDLAP